MSLDDVLSVLRNVQESTFGYILVLGCWLLYKIFLQFKRHFDSSCAEHAEFAEVLSKLSKEHERIVETLQKSCELLNKFLSRKSDL